MLQAKFGILWNRNVFLLENQGSTDMKSKRRLRSLPSEHLLKSSLKYLEASKLNAL